MRGVIVAIAPDGSYGQLSAEDGQRYSYWTKEVRNGQVQPGQTVEFQMWEGQPIDIFAVQAPSPPRAPQRPSAPQQMAPRTAAPSPYAAAQSAYPAAAAPASYSGEGFPPTAYWIKLFTSPSGRIARKQFWLHGVLVIVVASIVLAWIPIIGQILSLFFMWAGICIGFKRFHDLGYPGWWSLAAAIPSLAAAVLVGLGFVMTGFLATALLLVKILSGISLLIGLAQLFFVYIRIGQEGPNQYGPDPLAG